MTLRTDNAISKSPQLSRHKHIFKQPLANVTKFVTKIGWPKAR